MICAACGNELTPDDLVRGYCTGCGDKPLRVQDIIIIDDEEEYR